MMTPNKYSTAVTVQLNDFDGFECSERNTPINYMAIKAACLKLFGDLNICVGFAVKLNLHNLKIRSDDYIKIKGTPIMLTSLVEKMRSQEGYVSSKKNKEGADISVGKTVVTPLRVARAFASEVTALIKAGKVKVPDDHLTFAGGQLPAHYCFLAAPYGMGDEDFVANFGGMLIFATAFDKKIEEAVSMGWAPGAVDKRSHAEALTNYAKWRKFDIKGPGEA